MRDRHHPTPTVEFFFDLSSPWTRLAFDGLQPIAKKHNVPVVWRPFLVGGVFNAVNDSVYAERENPDDRKTRHSTRWLHEWAQLAGLKLTFPSPLHPLRSVLPMRFCCALESDQVLLLAFMTRCFRAYFEQARNISSVDELVVIADECGIIGANLADIAASEFGKFRLRRNTEEAIMRGAFGSPTIFVDNEFMYFGNDQMPLIEQRIASLLTSSQQ